LVIEVSHIRNTPQVSLEGARAAISTALAAAAAADLEISVCVVDAAGFTVASSRMDGAELQTVRISEVKARCAAFTGTPTGRISKAGNEGSDHHLLAITLAAGVENFISVPGGYPVIVDGLSAGGVGVSGAAHADAELAKAAAAAMRGSAA
jgi:uncharacterized protein GlcG (DUF336 family)